MPKASKSTSTTYTRTRPLGQRTQVSYNDLYTPRLNPKRVTNLSLLDRLSGPRRLIDQTERLSGPRRLSDRIAPGLIADHQPTIKKPIFGVQTLLLEVPQSHRDTCHFSHVWLGRYFICVPWNSWSAHDNHSHIHHFHQTEVLPWGDPVTGFPQ
jgi:hypothetical protein